MTSSVAKKAKTNIFITGATGYIGGSVLLRFLRHSDFEALTITALVRSQEKADKFSLLGIEPLVGSLSDFSLLAKAASEADVVINMANADNLDAVKALLKGLEQRHQLTGTVPSLIHTASVLSDTAGGMYAHETIYKDDDPDQIETLGPMQIHRLIDLAVIEADKRGFVKTYVILPSLIYGMATGKLVDLGLQNKYSMQVPFLISVSLDRGQGGMIGEGKNIWPNVHIDDVSDLYVVLYDAIRTNASAGHGREGIYFAENGEHNFYELGAEISKVLFNLGRGNSVKPTTFTKEELDKYFHGSDAFGANSRCRGNRSRAIGWKPTKSTADLLESIKPEVQSLLEESRYKEILARFAVFFSSAIENYIKLIKENISS